MDKENRERERGKERKRDKEGQRAGVRLQNTTGRQFY